MPNEYATASWLGCAHMTILLKCQVLNYRYVLRCRQFDPLFKRFSSSTNGPSSDELMGRVVPLVDGSNQNSSRNLINVRQTVDDVCRVLENNPWGPVIENAPSVFVEKPQLEIVVGVLRRLKDVKKALQYFRWVEGKTEQAHCPEAYNSLLMVMARSRNFDYLEQILEEMSIAGFGPSNNTCIELVATCIKSQKLREAYGLIETMRKLKFRPAFSAYTTLIGALSASHSRESDLMLSLFHQMQELGYEVTIHLFITLVREFAKEGRVDAALSLLDEMKSNSVSADLVLYNVCIDCFGKVGNVDMAWKFFHEMKAQGPCVYAYNTMIMGYGLAGKFDEAYSLLERQKRKGCIPSIIAYNCILTCLGKKGKLEAALGVQDTMKEVGLFPNIMTVNIMIDRLCKAQRLDEACSIFLELDHKVCTPDAATFCSLIDGLGRYGRVDDAYMLYEQMLDSGQVPNVVVYTSLIRNFFKCGRKEDAH
ncbi:pentatricopeptide repeat-containing protein [Senna tora]|uniref:Pentatricopeptide repeat-containing protein n=1 Tax=Senna tora TaxID=362788 RepID=A0A834T7T1_9FABA|nr:pentatricopeptide repeat-containing protein [Senna tora]